MQKHGAKIINSNFTLPVKRTDSFTDELFGVINPYVPRTSLESEAVITQKQIEILEDAIKRYERLEDVRRFSSIVLEDIENVTEEEIKRAVELENTVSIEDEKAVLNLIQNEGFLQDLESADFSDILNSSSDDVFEDGEDFSDFDL